MSGSDDSTVRVWDSARGLCERVIQAHKDWVLSVSALGDSLIASGSRDGTLRLWDANTGVCRHTHTSAGAGPVVASAIFAPGAALSGASSAGRTALGHPVQVIPSTPLAAAGAGLSSPGSGTRPGSAGGGAAAAPGPRPPVFLYLAGRFLRAVSADPSADPPAEIYIAPGLLSLAVGASRMGDGGCIVYVGALDGGIHAFEFSPGGSGGGSRGGGGGGGGGLVGAAGEPPTPGGGAFSRASIH